MRHGNSGEMCSRSTLSTDLAMRPAGSTFAILAPVNSPLQPLDRRLLRNRRGALTLAAALAAFVALCWIVIQLHGSFPGDSGLISWMRDPHPREPLAFFAHVFALLGNPIVAGLCVAIVWVVIDDDLGPRYGILVLAAVSAVALNALLKAILGPTPLQISTRGAFAPGNFPSGHVVYITSLCSLLGWFALARGHRATSVAMLLLILAMGPLRVIDGAHWPSDVLAGYALALAWTIVVLVIGLPWAAGQKQIEDCVTQVCEVGTGASDAPTPFGDAAPSADGPSVLGGSPPLPPPAA